MSMRRPSITKRRHGFTLIEALFGLALSVLIGGAVWSLQHDFTNLNLVIQGTLVGQLETNRAFKAMSAEMRAASSSSLGAYPLAEVTATSFTLYSDPDKDGIKDRLRYFLDNGSLKRGVITPSGNPLVYNPASESVTVVVRDVANGATPIFSYFDTTYDGTGQPLAQPVDVTAVRLVKISLIIDKNGSRSPSATTLTTQISLRNLKDNT